MLPWMTHTSHIETLWNRKRSLDSAPFDKCLLLLAQCVIKQKGIVRKPSLWCHTHLSTTLDVCEGETEFDSPGISLNHTAGCITVLPPEAIKEVSLLKHPSCNKLTACTVNMLPDPPTAVTDLLFTMFLQRQQRKQNYFLWQWNASYSTFNLQMYF